MNPFTHFLQQWSADDRLAEFVAHWDMLERIVVAIYRKKMEPEAAEAEFWRVWPWLRAAYGDWEATLRPFWQVTRVAGAPTQTDPFQLLLTIESPQAIRGDWRAMQHLPAAREALNQLILQESGD